LVLAFVARISSGLRMRLCVFVEKDNWSCKGAGRWTCPKTACAAVTSGATLACG
jgi:hypothetical protein